MIRRPVTAMIEEHHQPVSQLFVAPQRQVLIRVQHSQQLFKP
jgi:hypothetical protein